MGTDDGEDDRPTYEEEEEGWEPTRQTSEKEGGRVEEEEADG